MTDSYKVIKPKRGDYHTFNCATPYCRGEEGRCLFCGGIYSECGCHVNFVDGCICGCHATQLKDIKNINIIRLLKALCFYMAKTGR